MNPLIEIVVVFHGLIRFPGDAFQRKQMMQPEGAEPDRAIAPVRMLGLQYFDIVDVDDVVEHSHLDRNEAFEHVGPHGARQMN